MRSCVLVSWMDVVLWIRGQGQWNQNAYCKIDSVAGLSSVYKQIAFLEELLGIKKHEIVN